MGFLTLLVKGIRDILAFWKKKKKKEKDLIGHSGQSIKERGTFLPPSRPLLFHPFIIR